MIFEFLERISKNIQIENFMKLLQSEGGCSVPTDGEKDRQADVTKIRVGF